MRESNKRIAKNTLALYFRQILILLISLYTSRVILAALGVVDFGIYNVVAGVVGMFSFLSSSMAAAVQRFFSFELGKHDYDKLQKTFSMTLVIYILLALLIVLLAESVGLWLLENKLVIPDERMSAARYVYQFAIASFIFTMLAIPYTAVIIAHENMKVYAYNSIVDATLRLLIAVGLTLTSWDKLKLYGALMFFATATITMIYYFYCYKNYSECRISLFWDRNMFKKLFSFAGWNLFGASVGLAKSQIMNILLNIFFGPVVNAARAIAAQVNQGVSSFSQNFFTAVRPQIIKNYAVNEIEKMTLLMYRSAKVTFFLMLLFILPLILEMPFVLNIWLKNVPQNAILFTRLILIETLLESVSYPLIAAATATGTIKLYQSVVGGILLLNLPIGYLVLCMGYPAFSVMVVSIILALIAFIARLIILEHLMSFSSLLFLKKILGPALIVFLLSFIPSFVWISLMDYSLWRMMGTMIISGLLTCTNSIFFGLTPNERTSLWKMIQKRLKLI